MSSVNSESGSLVDILLEIPGIDKKGTRDALLAALPRSFRESLEPRPAGTTNDVIHIVEHAKKWPLLQDGTLPIESIIRPAILMVKGTELEDKLKMQLHKCRKHRPSSGTTPFGTEVLTLEGDRELARKRDGDMHNSLEVDEVIEFLSDNSTIIRLRDYRVVGNFASTSRELDRSVANLCDRIICAHHTVLVSLLLCAESGSGKTYFVRQLFKEVKDHIKVEYVSADASRWKDTHEGLNEHLADILARRAEGYRVIAFLDEVDAAPAGQHIYKQLLAPMAGDAFCIRESDFKLDNLFWFFAASAAPSMVEFKEVVDNLPGESKARDFLSRIGENWIDLPSVRENGVERIVRALSILSGKLPKLTRVDTLVLLYIGLMPFESSRELKQLITRSLETLSRDLTYFRWSYLRLDNEKREEFRERSMDHYKNFMTLVIKVDRE